MILNHHIGKFNGQRFCVSGDITFKLSCDLKRPHDQKSKDFLT